MDMSERAEEEDLQVVTVVYGRKMNGLVEGDRPL